MTRNAQDGSQGKCRPHRSPDVLYFAGVRYWTASVLPAIVGTTLPFWLRPPGFSFSWVGAIEFLADSNHPNYQVIVFPDASHTLTVPGTATEFVPGYLDTITDWLGRHVGSGLSAGPADAVVNES